MNPAGTLLLTKSEVQQLLSFSACIDVVEDAFRMHGMGRSMAPQLIHIDAEGGEFHVKAGGLTFDKPYFGLKANGAFAQNSIKHGMPNIQGVILLSDGATGYPLAVMDSREITMKRTGAATAVAAKYLAQQGSDTVTICGSGLQARIQLMGIASMFPLKTAYLYSRSNEKAANLAKELSVELAIDVRATKNLPEALRLSQICVTCTPAHKFFIKEADVPAGIFIAGVGADSPGKQEIDPKLLRSNKVVADILGQCVQVGDLQHAIAGGMRSEEVHAELAEIVLGTKPGRTSNDEITIFDSTGTALQDVAAAVAVYKAAISQGKGQLFDFFR